MDLINTINYDIIKRLAAIAFCDLFLHLLQDVSRAEGVEKSLHCGVCLL